MMSTYVDAGSWEVRTCSSRVSSEIYGSKTWRVIFVVRSINVMLKIQNIFKIPHYSSRLFPLYLLT